MAETNQLWVASYLHVMLGAYIDDRPGERGYSALYEETLLAAGIVETGICSCDDHFLEFIKNHPDSKAAFLYQVIRHFPDYAVRNGAAIMIERLTTASFGNGFLSLRTGVPPDTPAAFPDTSSGLIRMRAGMCKSDALGRI